MSIEGFIFGVVVATLVTAVIIPYRNTLKTISEHYDNYLIALYHANVSLLLTDFECQLYLSNMKNRYVVSLFHIYGDIYFDDCIKDEKLYACSVGRLKQCADIMKGKCEDDKCATESTPS